MGRISKANFFKGKYETKLEFPERRGGEGELKPKKSSMVGVWIFSGTTHLQKNFANFIEVSKFL